MEPESRSKLPPATMSTVIPALPSSLKNGAGKGWTTSLTLGGVAIFCIGGVGTFAFQDPELRSMLLAACLVMLFALTMVSTWKMRNLMTEREDYERRLQQATYTLVEKNSNLKQLVQIDPLTQLLNRRGLEKALQVEMNRAQRQGLAVYAVLLDCDDFKGVNEGYGHAVGDLVLQNMAVNIFRSVRPTDYASRIGGDEFIVLLIDVTEEEARRIADRIRTNIAESPALSGGKAVPCTASLGAAELPMGMESIEEILQLCRQSLKTSKASGKNALTIVGLQKSK